MTCDPMTAHTLNEHLHDPSSSFSIGSFGAIAEFHRDGNEPLTIDLPSELTAATTRGALRIKLTPDVLPVAYETLSRRPGRWQHGVVFCRPQHSASSNRRTAITELGVDAGAIRPEDRNSVLFDMGLGARNVDFCIRTRDPQLLATLRRFSGRAVLEPRSQAMAAIIESSPHRISISKLGRLEVYQAIGTEKTPEGPHTHVLPKFLKSRRTHSANVPVPHGYLPCLSLHPANPLFDSLGNDKPFGRSDFTRFQLLLEHWGAPEYRQEKHRVLESLASGHDPAAYVPPETRLGRTALRIALRQAFFDRDRNTNAPVWARFFDGAYRRCRD